MTSLAERIGKRILFLRKRVNVSQEKFAELVNLNKNYLGNLELGKQIPTITTVEKITNALDMSLRDFFEDL
uniref:Helix-turn-helix domain protein n=1 Tax=Siphoviridae sp. ctgn638 TaxID=2827913 RepID=A0A8S5TKP9_9CAUD|nr:MAG TPA: helix-turn-helix domain protein [Siphoviridae sp. ctgn638]